MPQPVATWAEAQSLAVAVEAFTAVLSDDGRVCEAYASWREAHGLDGWLVRMRGAGVVAADVFAFEAAILLGESSDLASIGELCAELGLLTYRPWLSPLLLTRFRLSATGECTGKHDYIGFNLAPSMRARIPGRAMQGDGRHVYRDVEWFYRNRVKCPVDSVSELAREYTAIDRSHRKGDGRSLVKERIDHARALLDRVTLVPPHYSGTLPE